MPTRPTMTRRDLLCAGAAGLMVPASTAADTTRPLRLQRIGLQLYTVRAALRRDLEGTVAAVARAGVTDLEFFDLFGQSVPWWRAVLARHGLAAPSTHAPLPPTDAGWSAIFDRARAMGHQLVVVPWVGPEHRGSRSSWQRLAERLDIAALKARAAGLQFGYHNHDFEFAPVDGTTGWEVLTTQTDPTAVKLQLDLYWAVKAEQDPLAILRRWPHRVVAVHVKDAGPAPARRMMDVGAGTIDFRTILATGRRQGLAHWFIEHDDPADPIASVTTSAAAMRQL
jgi:sugar phosphate isomerase/epimerase